MMKTDKKIKIELFPAEFKALQDNGMISDLCDAYLGTAVKHGGFIVLTISKRNAEDFAGWVAGEVNHSKCSEKQEILNSACESIEASTITAG
jgi:hypothetical protein